MLTQDIAVIGLSCRFPGAKNYREYWDNLLAARSSVGETPGNRWNWQDHKTADADSADFTRWAGFVQNPDCFDAAFFGVSPREAERMDPQQRLVLEESWHCIQDAGYNPRNLSGKNIGVFIAAGTFDYKELQEQFSAFPEGHEATGVHNSVIANRISYFFSLHGPSVVVDTACSSSLVAMQQAVAAIQLGHCESALVGGVGLLLTPTTFIRFGKMGMLSPTGKCSAFDADANGYVRGEGVGMVMLKPLDQAIADNDHIWGVIKSVAINHGGKVRSLTSPSALAQAKLIVDAVQQADIPAHSINYIETHGTGTPLGDPIEIHGLSRAFNQLLKNSAAPTSFCGLGAVKANIGHLECAAGMAGLIKILLAMKHKTLPGHANFKTLNPRIKLDDSPFYLVDKARAWDSVIDSNGVAFPLRAGLSSFGFGGVNGHLIVEQAPEESIVTGAIDNTLSELLTLSATSATALNQLARNCLAELASPDADWRALCALTNQRQAGLTYRKSIVADSLEALQTELTLLSNSSAVAPVQENIKVAFVFSGQGAQYAGMGAALYQESAAFRTALDQCDQLLQPMLGKSIIQLMFNESSADIHLTHNTQPALFALEYALVKMWQSLGITPDVIIGHSIGELAGACVAGIFSLEDALRIVVKRGALMGSLGAAGKMVAVFATENEVNEILQDTGWTIDIAAINSPTGVVISGSSETIEAATQLFNQKGIDTRPLAVSQAFHSVLMEPILAEFKASFDSVQFSSPKVKLVSNLSGKIENQLFCSANYWCNHVRNTVQFQAGITTLIEQGVTHFIEIGPSPMMVNLAKRTLADKQTEAALIASIRPDEHAKLTLIKAVGQLFEGGFAPQLAADETKVKAHAVRLPFYPFDNHRYWIPTSVQKPVKARNSVSMPGAKLDLAMPAMQCYQSQPVTDFGRYLLDHKVKGYSLMPAAGYLSSATAALRQLFPEQQTVSVIDVHFQLPLYLDNETAEMQTWLNNQPGDAANWLINISGKQFDQDQWQTCATATFVARNEGSLGNDMSAELLDHFKLIPSVPQEDFYRQCNANGLEYGPAFRAVKHIIESDNKVFGHLHLPESCSELAPDCFALHPSLLDGALQLVTLLAQSSTGKIPLPVGVKEFRLHRGGDSALLAIAQLDTKMNNCADIRLYTMQGNLVGEIRGLEFRWVSAEQIKPVHATAKNVDFYFTPQWRERSLAAAIKQDLPAVIVYSDANKELAELIKSTNPTAFLCQLGDQNTFQNYIRQRPDIERVYFIAPQSEVTGLSISQLNKPLIALMEQVQQLLAQGYDRKPMQWIVISTGSYGVADEKTAPSMGSAFVGFMCSVCKEQKQWRIRHIDLPMNIRSGSELLQKIENIAATDIGEEWVVRGNQYWHRALSRCTFSSELNTSAFREQGVYLITGGAQGIGAALAEKLAKEKHARLILLGRSARDAKRVEFEQYLSSLGGKAIYVQADVADYASLRSAVLHAEQQFGAVNGVIHSAGIINDAAVRNLTAEMIEQVAAPKISGSINLYRAVSDQPLDFLLLFSSVMAWLAYAGQANYVAANAFVDSFASTIAPQSSFPVKVINWGHWGETGMASSDYYRERIARMGIHEISNDEGLAAISAVIANDVTQLVVMKADTTVLEEMGVEGLQAATSSTSSAKSFALPALADLGNLQDPATHDLLLTSLGNLIAQAMRMEVNQLLGDKAAFGKMRFTSLGIDSLTTVDLRKRVRDWLDVDVPADLLIGGAVINEVIDLLKQQILLQRLSGSLTANTSADDVNTEDEEVFVL